MDILISILFGIVEGITEWLPISSTGHLILLEQFLNFNNVSENFFDMFEVVIQLGAILAVVVMYWKNIFPFTNKKDRGYKKTGFLSHVDKNIMGMWGKILVACIPAAVIGLLFDDKINELFYNPTVIAIALIVFGIAFIFIENWHKSRKSEPRVNNALQITYRDALSISTNCSNFSRNITFRCYNNWWIVNRIISCNSSRIYILLGNTCNVWCKLIKTN